MKKHVFGIAIFSFIVFAAAFVYGIFSCSEITYIPKRQVALLEVPHCEFKRELREIKESATDSGIVTQAVFNAKTKKLSWELSPERITEFPVLHLFIKDADGIRLLHSIHTVQYFVDADARKFSNQYSELRNFSSKSNLYLIPDMTATSAEDETESQVQAKFEIDRAIPVTIDYGK